jgi:hypothetical protein
MSESSSKWQIILWVFPIGRAQFWRTFFHRVHQVGDDIDRHKHRRISQRTWKDSNCNTRYLD